MHEPSPANPNERILRWLCATPEQQAAIDRILAGEKPGEPVEPKAPMLLGMGAAAALLGISRATLWRMLNAGKLDRVEVLPGSFRVRRADVENFVRGTKP